MKKFKESLYYKIPNYFKNHKRIPVDEFDDLCRKLDDGRGDAEWFIEAAKKTEYVKLINSGNKKHDYYVLSMRAYMNFTQDENIRKTGRQSNIAISIAIATLLAMVFIELRQDIFALFT